MVERRRGRAYSLSATNKDDRYIRVLTGGGGGGGEWLKLAGRRLRKKGIIIIIRRINDNSIQ